MSALSQDVASVPQNGIRNIFDTYLPNYAQYNPQSGDSFYIIHVKEVSPDGKKVYIDLCNFTDQKVAQNARRILGSKDYTKGGMAILQSSEINGKRLIILRVSEEKHKELSLTSCSLIHKIDGNEQVVVKLSATAIFTSETYRFALFLFEKWYREAFSIFNLNSRKNYT